MPYNNVETVDREHDIYDLLASLLIKTPTKGLVYEDVYDVNTKKIINQEYLKVQDEVRAEFKEMGFDVPCS